MKRLLVLSLALLMATLLCAQSQQGYVKTRGRLDAKGNLIHGEGLKGATVYIKGRTATLVKDTNGAFSFPVPTRQYQIDSVRKKGYQLVDMDFCYKSRHYSPTPIDILMELPDQSIEDYMEDFNRINASQQARINQLRTEVKQLKAQNKINEEEYRRRLAEITQMQSESQRLVTEMAERYSKMDFDRMDDFNRQVGWLILNGELIKADSLIRSKGNMEQRSADLDKLRQANQEVRADLEKSEAQEARELQDFATDCYNLYEIAMLRHDYDSAGYWLELRASKDTLDFDYVWECGSFYLNERKFEKARRYLELLTRSDRLLEVEKGIAYNDLSLCHFYMGDTLLGLTSMKKSLDIRTDLVKADPARHKVSLALASSNYAAQVRLIGDDTNAEHYFKLGMQLYDDLKKYSHFFSVSLANVEENYALHLQGKDLLDEAERYYLSSYRTRCNYAERYPQYYNTLRTIALPEIERMIGTSNTDSLVFTKECKMIIRSAASSNKERIASLAKALSDLYYAKGDMDCCQHYLDESCDRMEALFDEDRDKFLYELSYYYIADACFSFYSKNDTVKTLHYVDKTLALLDDLTDAQKKDVWPSLYEVAILQGNMHQDDPHYVVDRYEEARQVLLNYADTTLAANKTSLVQISQSLVVAQLKLAFKHLGEGRLEEAKNQFTSMTATMDANPSSFLLTDRAWVYYYLGAVDHRLNDTLGASRALSTALRLLEGAERSEQTTSLENTIRDLLQQVQSMPNDGEK